MHRHACHHQLLKKFSELIHFFPSRLRCVHCFQAFIFGSVDIYFHAPVLVMETGWCVYWLTEWIAHNTSLFKIKDNKHEIRPFSSLIQTRNMKISKHPAKVRLHILSVRFEQFNSAVKSFFLCFC